MGSSPARKPPRSLARRVGVALGLATSVPALLLLVLGIAAPVSPLGLAFLVVLLVATIGLITAPLRVGRWRGITRASTAALICIVALRCAVVHGDGGGARVVTLGASGETAPRHLNRVLPERDLALGGSRMLSTRRFVPAGFVRQLGAVYDRMEREVGQLPSPLNATYLGLQRPEAFDVVVVEGRGQRRADTAVVFLHGYAGNVSAICWLVALAARDHGVTTHCPSVGFAGDWWRPHGARTLGAMLTHLERAGVRRVFLVGLSNGARGASLLAPRFARRIVGLVLLSGIDEHARPPALPVLLLHGAHDPGVPAGVAKRYLAAARQAKQVTVPGDHFVLVTRERQVREALSGWLRSTALATAR